jgi:hypothetical protein
MTRSVSRDAFVHRVASPSARENGEEASGESGKEAS